MQKRAYFHLLHPQCRNSLIFFRHDLLPTNSGVIFCHSQILLICLIDLPLPNLYFCTIRPMGMFLQILNKVNIRVLIQTLPRPSLNHKVKLQQLLGEGPAKFWVYSDRQIRSPSSALSWIRDPLLNVSKMSKFSN